MILSKNLSLHTPFWKQNVTVLQKKIRSRLDVTNVLQWLLDFKRTVYKIDFCNEFFLVWKMDHGLNTDLQFKFCHSCQVFKPWVGYSLLHVEGGGVWMVCEWIDVMREKIKWRMERKRKEQLEGRWGWVIFKREMVGEGGEPTF